VVDHPSAVCQDRAPIVLSGIGPVTERSPMTDTAMTPGTYTLGPAEGTLQVHTGRHGAAARAGHDLDLEVGIWSATLTLAVDPSQTTLRLTAGARSLRVIGAHGGISSLADDDRASIAQTVDEKVLRGGGITFNSSRVTPDGLGRLAVHGVLELAGTRGDVDVALTFAEDGQLSGRAVITQSQWGMKPYSGLFGTLKVDDDVTVTVDARLRA
jgi:hypothetical protein